jgi:hypothetical protein
MSRWSPEEDLSILETIQLLSEEPKYSELVEYHNKQFNKTRTEQTYKSRVNKIAKENNIPSDEIEKWFKWIENVYQYILIQKETNEIDKDIER